MRQLWPRAVKQHAQGHTASETAGSASEPPLALERMLEFNSSTLLSFTGRLLHGHFPVCYAPGAAGSWTDTAWCRRRHQVLSVPRHQPPRGPTGTSEHSLSSLLLRAVVFGCTNLAGHQPLVLFHWAVADHSQCSWAIPAVCVSFHVEDS